MKLKRILAAIIAVAMTVSIVPMAFAATAGIDVDFTSTDFDGFASFGNNTSKQTVASIYGRDDTAMSITSTTNVLNNLTAGRYYFSDVALTSEDTRLSFKIAAADTLSVKGVSFVNAPPANVLQWALPSDVLFKMNTDGNMYVLDTNIGAYETEKWYQIDIVFNSTGIKEVYVNGRLKNENAIAYANMSAIFGDASTRYLLFYMTDKASGNTSTMYLDDIETETSDATSNAAVPSDRKIEYTHSCTIENGMVTNLGDGASVESVLASFNVTNGTIRVVDTQGETVTSGALVQGMKVEISSVNGENKEVYLIDCLNLVLTAPANESSTRALTENMSVSFNESNGDYVEFYVNGLLKETVTSAPYEYTINHVAGVTSYEVYAVVVTAGDVRTETEKRTYTFVENSIPTVSVVDVIGNAGAFASVLKTDTVKFNVTATDSDYAESGLEKVELYFDGALVASKEVDPANIETLTLDSDYVVSNLTMGTHGYYAKAYDVEGAVATSAEVTFSVVDSASTDIDYATFEFGNESIMEEFSMSTSEPQLATVVDPLNPNNNVKGYVNGQFDTIYLRNNAGTFAGVTILYFELDFMTNNPSVNTTFEIRTKTTEERTTDVAVPDLGIEANKWYRMKYIVNSQTSMEEFWLSEDGGVTWVNKYSGPTNQTLGGAFASNRVCINKTKTPDYEFYIDNIHTYKVEHTSYVTGIKYLNAFDAVSPVTNGEVNSDVMKIKIEYNNSVGTYFFGDATSNFVITDSEGNVFDRFTASAVDTVVTITFDVALKSQETYTVRTQNLFESLVDGTPESFTFTTGVAQFDAVNAVIATDGSGGTMTVKNSGGSVTATVIYAVYSGDKLIKLGKQEGVTFGPGDTSFTVDPATDIGTGTGDLTAKVFFWSDLTAARTVKMGAVE